MAAALLSAGCTLGQTGPVRPIPIQQDVDLMKALAAPEPDQVSAFLVSYNGLDPGRQAIARNQIVTARMYIADMEYHDYEAKLTKDIEEEGLAATLTSLGLTTSSTLLASSATKTVLSGLATGVIGADKAFNEKVLLSNTIQALQTQMRADRKEQAATIFGHMLDTSGNPTPIAKYTLPMALSDVDGYYQAGTIASALIGMSKTLAAKETHADEAKVAAGPNPGKVEDLKQTAAPNTRSPQMLRVAVTSPGAQSALFSRVSGLLLPGGKTDAAIEKYVKDILDDPTVDSAKILTNRTKYAPAYQKIADCIVQFNVGRQCPAGSLKKFK
ncbi:MAG: hypothetical protein ACTHLO_02580 [Pseudolabrys sp.]